MKRTLKTGLMVLALVAIALVSLAGVQTSQTLEQIIANLKLGDDFKLYFGASNNASVEWDADGTTQLRFTGSAIFEDPVAFAGSLLFSGGYNVPDDTSQTYGSDDDWDAKFDTATGDLQWTAASADSNFNILVGNLVLGDPSTADQTLNGVDMFIAGFLEVGGVSYLQGGAIVPDDITLAFGTDSDNTCQYVSADNEVVCTGYWLFDSELVLNNGLDMLGGIGSDTDTSLEITTNSKTRKTLTAPISYSSATAFDSAYPFSEFLCVGLAAGVAHIGSAEGNVQVGDAADFLRVGFSVPELATVGAAGDLEIEFDILEVASEDVNIDVVIYEYGSTVAIVTDTITITNGTARGWFDLDTLSDGIGALVSVGEFLLIEITATADTDDFDIYGARVTYSVGVENDAT